jgi:hypothetical protein
MGSSPNRVNPKTMKWHLLRLQFSHSIKYEEQTLVGWESGYHFARRKGNKSYKTGIKTCSFKIKWGGGWGVMVFNAKSNRECENMFRIYKEELSSIFLKFLKLYLVRYCINKMFRVCYGSDQFYLFGSFTCDVEICIVYE